MTKSSISERYKRINAAIKLLTQYSSNAQVVVELMKLYNVSKRQAYRYVQEALVAEHLLPVPEEKIVFTVKLPASLLQRTRKLASSTGHSLSDIMTQALEDFLSKGAGCG